MAVRTRVLSHGERLSPGVGASGGQWIIFQCPTDRTAIVKDVRLGGEGPAVAQPGRLEILKGSSEPCGVLYGNVGAGTVLVLEEEFLTMQEGDQLAYRNLGATATEVRWHVSGALLLGDPS